MSRIIKAERLVVDRNYTLVGEEIDLYEDEDIIEEQIALLEELEAENEAAEEPDPIDLVAEAQQQVAVLQAEAERILQETESMVVEILERARGEATVIISNAREEAQAILLEAQQEAERLKANALDQGHREGLQLAFRETEEQRKKARQEYEQLVNAGNQQKAELIRAAEPEIVNLAVAIAEKILVREIKTDPSIILDIVREALKLAGEAENVRIMVHPDDTDTVKYFVPQLIEPDQNIGDVAVEGDRRIDRGGCLVETEKGIIDARLQTRRFNIEGALTEGISHA